MSDTPETDAKRITHLDLHLQPDGRGRLTGDTNIEVVPADFARQLERERDEARSIARWLYQHGMATLKEGAYRRPWVKEVIR